MAKILFQKLDMICDCPRSGSTVKSHTHKWPPGRNRRKAFCTCTASIQNSLSSVSRAVERGPPPIPCMGCLRHRCSVSLLNNSARARSLSGDALLLIRCCGSTDCARMEYALFLRENFVTVAAEPASSACGHRTDCARTEHPLFLRESYCGTTEQCMRRSHWSCSRRFLLLRDDQAVHAVIALELF